MNRHNRTGEEIDLSHLVDSGINNHSNTSNNNSSSVKTNSNHTAPSNVTILPNSHSSNVSNNNDPIATFVKNPNKVSRNIQNEKNKAERTLKTERETRPLIPRSNVAEVEGKTTAFIPYTNKDGSIAFHSFSIHTKTTTNMTVEHITPPYVNQSNKKNNVQ
jgi:hypothetical protein